MTNNVDINDNIKNIKVYGAKQNNLQNIDVVVPKYMLVIVTGPSGSGKSSFARGTVHAEAQRLYMESLSSYARQFLDMQSKPNVEFITGLSPSVAIDQKTISHNPRSTVGTITEIYDYLRLLFSRIGVVYSPATGHPIQGRSPSQIVAKIEEIPVGSSISVMACIANSRKGEFKRLIDNAMKHGFSKFKINGETYQYDEVPALSKTKNNEIYVYIDELIVKEDNGTRLVDAVESGLKLGDGILYVEIKDLPEDYSGEYSNKRMQVYSQHFVCPVSGFQIGKIEPRMFSFNSPHGACEECGGLGKEEFINPQLVVTDPNLSLKGGAIPFVLHDARYKNVLEAVAAAKKFSLDTPYKDLPDEIKQLILYGSLTATVKSGTKSVSLSFKGVVSFLEYSARSFFVAYPEFTDERACSECLGTRLKKEMLAVKIDDKHIGEICSMSIDAAHEWISGLENILSSQDLEIAIRVIKELKNRLEFLMNVGVEYLTLSREAETLSGGESQRIRLASQIGSGLTGVIYVLDEPSIGLHQSDNEKLIKTLKYLRDLGNSVLVIEHDEETMLESDYLIDFGPGSGVYGGFVCSQGTPQEIMQTDSLTGMYLSGRKKIEVPAVRRKVDTDKMINIIGARVNNLKNVNCGIPVGLLTCVSGISGGGKSSLIMHTLSKYLKSILDGYKPRSQFLDEITGFHFINKLIQIDQSPIGKTPRSNAATYIGLFDYIRAFYADLPESKARGYKVGRFSFNVKGGRCETCQGDGVIKIEMHFLPNVYVNCSECHNKRYNKETLEIRYKDKAISDILSMSVDEAMVFFEKIPNIFDKLDSLHKVGLGYLALGHPATMLSGGEAQRIKLAKELSKRSTGATLYILDEPTTGLHTDDIKKLLAILHQLVEMGNSVVVIEHNIDVLKTADYIIDVGPKGGAKGGYIVACGTPEEVAQNTNSVTGPFLKSKLGL